MKFRDLIIAVTLGLTASYAAYAHENRPKNSSADAAVGGAMTEGEIRKVDKDAKKITIKHGPIQNLDMPSMTMVFQVKNPAMLDQVATGDKIKFAVEKTGGALVVTHIEVAK